MWHWLYCLQERTFHFNLQWTVNSDKRPIRFLDIDTLNGNLNIESSNRGYIDTYLTRTSQTTKSALYNENKNDNIRVGYGSFMYSRFHAFTSLDPQKAIVSNFGQYDNEKFWQMTTNAWFRIEYDRVEMKPLKHQWNKLLGPVSLSGVDVFNIQYNCINGTVTWLPNISQN